MKARNENRDGTWLYCSIFCDKSHWHTVLREGIFPFIRLLKENPQFLLAYYVSFNYLSGENIRLALKCPEQRKKTLARTVDKYFKSYLNNSSFLVKKYKLPISGIFLPFPSNTIQYGLYGNSNQIEYEVAEVLSRTIIDVLPNDVIDDDLLITFAFYLQVSLLKVTGASLIDPSETKSTVDRTVSLPPDTISQDLLMLKFLNSKESMIDIYRYIYISAEAVPEWISSWSGFWEKKIADTALFSATEFYNTAVKAIHNQLGFTNNMSALVDFFLLNTRTLANNDSPPL